jgi:DNA-binding transcriptional MocR family regulator
MEQATYGGAISRFTRHGAKLVGVPLDQEGLRPDALESAITELAAKGIRPKYIYTIPTVQNPTGAIMGTQRRADVLAIAATHGIPIVEDECYSGLLWTPERPAAMKAMTTSGNVIFVGSFSKSIAPALRVGYVVADWPILSRMVACKTDGGTGALEQMVLAEFCEKHFDTHVATLNKALKRKLDVLVEALGEQFGTAAEFDVPRGRHLPVGQAARRRGHAKAGAGGACGRRRLQSRARMDDRQAVGAAALAHLLRQSNRGGAAQGCRGLGGGLPQGNGCTGAHVERGHGLSASC